MLLTVLFSAYDKETQTKEDGRVDERVVLRLHPALAPYKVAVLPLIKKTHGQKAEEIFDMLNEHVSAVYDETANIGKRYRRQDAIGTPYAICVDDTTLNEGTVTVRDRDTMTQTVLKIEEVLPFIESKLKF